MLQRFAKRTGSPCLACVIWLVLFIARPAVSAAQCCCRIKLPGFVSLIFFVFQVASWLLVLDFVFFFFYLVCSNNICRNLKVVPPIYSLSLYLHHISPSLSTLLILPLLSFLIAPCLLTFVLQLLCLSLHLHLPFRQLCDSLNLSLFADSPKSLYLYPTQLCFDITCMLFIRRDNSRNGEDNYH